MFDNDPGSYKRVSYKKEYLLLDCKELKYIRIVNQMMKIISSRFFLKLRRKIHTVDFRSSETASNELYTLKNNLPFPFIFVLVLLLFFSFSNEFLTSEIPLLKNKNFGPLNDFTIYFWLTSEFLKKVGERESMTRNNLVPSLIKWSPHSLPIFFCSQYSHNQHELTDRKPMS